MLHPTLRRCTFWAHLATGVIAGSIIFLLAVTGILMSFETQIVGSVERSMVREKGSTQIPLSPEALVTKFQSSGIEGRPGSLSLNSDPEMPANFVIGRGSQQLFHPATGEAMGKGAEGTRRFFQIVLSLHRWLTWPTQRPEGQAAAQPTPPPAEGAAKPTTWRDIGGHVNAIGTLVFFFLLLSGLFLWIPKKMAWRAFKPVLLIQPKLKGRARDWNWHNIAGFWSSPLILIISLTGIIMFYPWANKLLFNAVGEQPPVRGAGGGAGGAARPGGPAAEGGPAREGGERRRGEGRIAASEGGPARPEGAEATPPGEGRPPSEGGERRRRGEGNALAEGETPRAEGAATGEGRPPGEGGERRRRGEGRTGGAAATEGGGGMTRGGREGAPTGPIIATGLDGAAEAAKKFMPGWETLVLELPSSDQAPFVATISDAGRGRPDRKVKLTLARADLSIAKQETFANLTTGGKLRQFVRWGHTGELGGWFGQLLAALACACTIVLVWTGFALAWRRLVGMKKKKQNKKPEPAKPVPTV